jgi:hypothetical protein
MFAPIRTLSGTLQERTLRPVLVPEPANSEEHRSGANDVLSSSHAKPGG